MRTSFVEYLQNKQLLKTSVFKENMHLNTPYDAEIIDSLSGYKIETLSKLNPKFKTKIICVLKSHLNAERKKAAIGSYQYNTNRHIGLLQALIKLKPKKTQPEAGCVIS